MNNKHNCISCKNIKKNNLGSYICGLTDIMTEPLSYCENYEKLEEIKNERKVSKYLFPVIILLIGILSPVVRCINRAEKKKETIAHFKSMARTMQRKIYFSEYLAPDEDRAYYRGIFYTMDTLCTQERFEHKCEQYLFKLPNTIKNNDTILVRNYLVYNHSNDSLKRLLLSMHAKYIKYYNDRFHKIKE